MKREEEIKKFKELIPKAVKVHPWTYCLKKGRMIRTIDLDAEECVNCPEFVLRGGVCDPL